MDAEKMTKLKVQSSRETRNPKQQNASVSGRPVWRLRFGAWNFSGALSFGLGAFVLAGCITDKAHDDSSTTRLVYPLTRTTNVVDDYHGVKVADPYRWLEDDNSPETKTWAEAENKVTFGYLQRIPDRPAIKERLTELWNYERYGVPFKQGGRYFYSKNHGLQNQNVLYTMAALDSEPR